MALWKWSALASVTSMVGVIGVIFAVLQYFSTIEADRSVETLNLIEKWTEDYRADFVTLRSDLLSVVEGDPSSVNLRQEVSTKDRADKFRKVVAGRTLALEGSVERLDNVAFFFNLLGLCIQSNACSHKTARVFFEDTFLNFDAFFGDAINERAKVTHGGIQGIQALRQCLGGKARDC